jgi:hypothetical protein
MCNKWMDMINNSKEQSAEFNIAAWLSRATLDAIGEGKIYSGYTVTFFLISFSCF